MRFFILGLVVGIVLLPLFMWLYFRFGYAPVATASSPIPFERKLAHMALNARIKKEMPKTVPIQATTDAYVAGAQIYRVNCAVCHGLPFDQQTATAKGMYPRPPELFKGHGVTDDPPGETYWKVTNGIRLTGMPAYTGSLSDQQRWQVSLMLANADKLPQEARTELARPLQVQ